MKNIIKRTVSMKDRKNKAYIFYGIILLLTLALIVILRTDVIENLFKDKIAKFITDRTGIGVSIGRIEISILSSSITVFSLNLKGDHTYRADIGKLTLVLEPPSILAKKPRLKVVYVDNAKISLTMNKKLPGKMHGNNTGHDIKEIENKLPVSLDHIVVSNASLSLSIPSYSTDISIKSLSMDAYPDIDNDKADGFIEITGMTLSKAGIPFTITELQFNGGLDNRDVSIKSLRLYSGEVSLSAGGHIRDYGNPNLDILLTASIKHIERLNPVFKSIPVSLPELSGSYSVKGTIKGNILNPSSTGDISFDDMTIGGVKGGTGHISYSLRSHDLTIKSGDVTIAHGTIKFNGEVNFADNTLPAKISLDLKGISFGGILSALTVPGPYVDGNITGKVAVQGTFNPVYLSGNADTVFRQFSVYDDSYKSKKKHTIMVVKPVVVKTGVIFTDQCAYITDSTVQSARSFVHAYTALYFTGAMFLTFDSHKMDMRDVSPIAEMPYSGIGSVKGFIAGPFTDITIHGDAVFNDFSLEHIKLGSVTGGISFTGDTLSLESIKAVRNESNLFVDGGIRFTDQVELHMGIKLAPLALTDITENAGITLSTSGSISGSARIDGPALKMNGFAEMSFSRPDFSWQTFDRGNVKLTVVNGVFHIDKAEFMKGENKLHIKGALAENGDMNIHFNSDEFNVDSIDSIVRTKVPLKALAVFKGSISGSTYNPVADISIEAKNIIYDKSKIPDFSTSMHFSGNTLSGSSDLFDGSIDMSTHLGLADGYPFELTAQFNKFNAMPLAAAFAGISITSDVTGKLWLVGKLKNIPGSLVGYIYLTTANVGNQYALLHNDEPVFIDIANDNLYFRDFVISGKDSLVKLTGFYNMNGGIDMLIDGDVDLGYVPVLTNVVAGATGMLKINTRIYGEKNNIDFNGEAELNGGASFTELPITLSGVHMSVVMAKNNIIVKEFNGNINSGSMSGSGRIITAGFLPRVFDLSLIFKDMNFVYNNTIPLQLEGELGMKGDYPQPVLEGNIRVINAVYTDYINWEDQMLKFQHRKFEPKTIEHKQGHPLKLNITIASNNSIIIDNNILNSILSAELKIIGTVDDPVIIGNISTNEGRIYYRSTTFTMDNAVVTYTQEHPQNPFVDLRASTSQQFMVNNEFTDYKIYLTIAGELNKLNVSLTSYPPNLDEMDIISLLTYGVTPSDLMKSGVSSAAAYEVGTAVGSKLAKDIFSEVMGDENLNKFKKIFWVDNIQVEPYYPIGAPSTSIRLIVTKRLSNDFDILYSNDLSGYNLQRFQGEYKLSRRLYFIGSWGNTVSGIQSNTSNNSLGNIGGDLKYKYEF